MRKIRINEKTLRRIIRESITNMARYNIGKAMIKEAHCTGSSSDSAPSGGHCTAEYDRWWNKRYGSSN